MKKFLMSSLKLGVGVFVGLFLLLLVIGVFASSDDASDSTNTPVAESPEAKNTNEETIENNQVEPPKTGTVFDYATWDYNVVDRIDEYTKAPAGKHYYVVTVHFDNQGTDTYSTNAFDWTLTADGVTYTTDAATYSMPDYKLVDVGPGGKTDAQFVYLVDGNPTELALNYNSW